MSEIEKLYELARIEREILRGCIDYYSSKGIDIWDIADCKNTDCKNCKYNKFIKYTPPFTAEKQIELIKWLAQHNFVVCKNLGGWHTGINPTYDEDFGITCSKRATNLGSFEYALAGLINNLWKDLTPEEKQQVKGILE